MSEPVIFQFFIGEEVWLPALRLSGVVVCRMDRGIHAFEYRVVFWADGKRNEEWLYGFELKNISEKNS